MSIATDCQRINNALSGVTYGKAAIADAITDKGVETPQDATFDVLAANIGDISGGGPVVEGGKTVTFFVDSEPYAVFAIKSDKTIPKPDDPVLASGAFGGWTVGGSDVTFPFNPPGDAEVYAKVEYPVLCKEIQTANTTATCDLGIKCASDYIVQVDFTPLTIMGNVYFGNKSTGDSDDFRLFGVSANSFFLDYGNAQSGRISKNGVLTANTPYKIEFGNHYIKNLDSGVVYVEGAKTDEFVKSHNVCIGGGDRLTFRNIKFIRDGEVFANFVPCVLLSSGKCYVMDTVGGKQYPCSGSWTYTL